MVNVFRLCSMINPLYGQVAGDLPSDRGDMIRQSLEQVSKSAAT